MESEDLSEFLEYELDFIKNAEQVIYDIMEEVEFEVGKVFVYGKEFNEPRQTSLHGDNPKIYKYSGKTKIMKPMTKTLLFIQGMIEEKYGKHFDFVLINHYRNGMDKIGLHSDSEKGIDKRDIISISLGAERRFRMKRKKDNKVVFDQLLKSGSVIRMKGECQDIFNHEVPAMKNVDGSRLNLTFRISK